MEQESSAAPVASRASRLASDWGVVLGLLLILSIAPIELKKWFGLRGVATGQLISGVILGTLFLRHDARESRVQRATSIAVFAIMFASLAVGVDSGRWSWALASAAMVLTIGLVRRWIARSRPNEG